MMRDVEGLPPYLPPNQLRKEIRMAYKEIPLTRGFVTIVDEDDYDWLIESKWCCSMNKSKKPYAAKAIVNSNGRKSMTLLHRLILNAPKGVFVDHINHNTVDNRKQNLRLCDYAGNSRNRIKFNGKSSIYKGVSWNKKSQKWRSSIMANSYPIYLGEFESEEVAAITYDEAAIRYHGEFASLNFYS